MKLALLFALFACLSQAGIISANCDGVVPTPETTSNGSVSCSTFFPSVQYTLTNTASITTTADSITMTGSAGATGPTLGLTSDDSAGGTFSVIETWTLYGGPQGTGGIITIYGTPPFTSGPRIPSPPEPNSTGDVYLQGLSYLTSFNFQYGVPFSFTTTIFLDAFAGVNGGFASAIYGLDPETYSVPNTYDGWIMLDQSPLTDVTLVRTAVAVPDPAPEPTALLLGLLGLVGIGMRKRL